MRQDTGGQKVAEVLLHEGRQRDAVRLPPGRLEEEPEARKPYPLVSGDGRIQHQAPTERL
jgi:hypothetical protein